MQLANTRWGKEMALAFSLFVIIPFGCDPNKDREFVLMSFILPINISPQNGKINVGDTLWIRADFPDTLQEFYSGKYYRIADFDFKTRIVFNKLIDAKLDLSSQPGSAQSFKVINHSGFIGNLGETFGDFKLHYLNGRYSCEIAIVPSAIGVYSIGFLWYSNSSSFCSYFKDCIHLENIIHMKPNVEGIKRIPVYEAFFHDINSGQVNHDLLLRNCKGAAFQVGMQNVYYLQRGTFAFEVSK
jgi:hypothetical protein